MANEVDYVPLEEAAGRISATLALIYPPGIGVIVPGERWDERARAMRDYFLAFEESFNRFPGFNYEVQGVFQERFVSPAPPGEVRRRGSSSTHTPSANDASRGRGVPGSWLILR